MEDNGKLNVVFIIDKTYLQHFTVACTSLLESNKHQIARIFLLYDNKNNPEPAQVVDFFAKKYAFNIELYGVDSSVYEKFSVPDHVSASTYFRFILPEILPPQIDSVLFLDSDLLVVGGLDELCQLDFTSDGRQIYLYAVDHQPRNEDLTELSQRFEKKFSRYFNAGVMLINLKLWRQYDIANRLIENTIKCNDRLLWGDQDILNFTLHNHWAKLSQWYNGYNIMSKGSDISPFRIIHYAGSSKPWHYMNRHPYKKLYWKYHALTPFKGCAPEGRNPVNIVKRCIPLAIKVFIKKILGCTNDRASVIRERKIIHVIYK